MKKQTFEGISKGYVKPGEKIRPAGIPVNAEVLGKRKANSKTFDLGRGHHKMVVCMGPIHYKNNFDDDEEDWKDIDLTIEEINGKVKTGKAHYDLEIFKDKIGYSYVSKRGGRVVVELVKIGDQPVDNNRFTTRILENQFFWDNVAEDIDLKIQLRPAKAELFKKLGSENASRKFTWKVIEDLDGNAVFRRNSGGIDSGDDRAHTIQMETKVLDEEKKNGKCTFFYEEEWTGMVGKIRNIKTRQKDWMTNATYPIFIDASTTENIVADADDGYSNTGTGTWRVHHPAYTQIFKLAAWWAISATEGQGGIRFQVLGIPQGSTINSADLKVQVEFYEGNQVGRFYADDVDSAAAWSNGNLPSGITKTSAFADLTPTVVNWQTVDVKNIVQEIISRPGWSSGNNLRFGCFPKYTGMTYYAQIAVYDYNKSQADAPTLVIDYTAPVSGIASYRQLIGYGQGTR